MSTCQDSPCFCMPPFCLWLPRVLLHWPGGAFFPHEGEATQDVATPCSTLSRLHRQSPPPKLGRPCPRAPMRGHLSHINCFCSRFCAGPARLPDCAFAVPYKTQAAAHGGSDKVDLFPAEEGLASVHHVVATGRCPHARFAHRVLFKPRSTPRAALVIS